MLSVGITSVLERWGTGGGGAPQRVLDDVPWVPSLEREEVEMLWLELVWATEGAGLGMLWCCFKPGGLFGGMKVDI